MKPIDFPQSTKVLQKQSGMTERECLPLPIWSNGKQCVSCWKPSFVERLKILFTGKIWVGMMSGATQPPIYVVGNNVFVKNRFSRLNVLKYHACNFFDAIRYCSIFKLGNHEK